MPAVEARWGSGPTSRAAVSRPVFSKLPPCPVESEASEEPEVETVPPAKLTTTIVGGTPKQREIIEQTLAGLGPTKIHSVWAREKVSEKWVGATPESVGIDVKYKGTDGLTAGRRGSSRTFSVGGHSSSAYSRSRSSVTTETDPPAWTGRPTRRRPR
jgi:hypothetical protein